jgi:hypothetical protein
MEGYYSNLSSADPQKRQAFDKRYLTATQESIKEITSLISLQRRWQPFPCNERYSKNQTNPRSNKKVKG